MPNNYNKVRNSPQFKHRKEGMADKLKVMRDRNKWSFIKLHPNFNIEKKKKINLGILPATRRIQSPRNLNRLKE